MKSKLLTNHFEFLIEKELEVILSELSRHNQEISIELADLKKEALSLSKVILREEPFLIPKNLSRAIIYVILKDRKIGFSNKKLSSFKIENKLFSWASLIPLVRRKRINGREGYSYNGAAS